jgi:hypothetical protein
MPLQACRQDMACIYPSEQGDVPLNQHNMSLTTDFGRDKKPCYYPRGYWHCHFMISQTS